MVERTIFLCLLPHLISTTLYNSTDMKLQFLNIFNIVNYATHFECTACIQTYSYCIHNKKDIFERKYVIYLFPHSYKRVVFYT